MKAINLQIGSQLRLGAAVVMLFVCLLGVVSYQMNVQLSEQTKMMYNHPLQVRRALGRLETDIQSMRLGLRELMLAKTDQEKQASIQFMEISAADVLRQFNIIYDRYLGPRTDIDEAYNAYIIWKTDNEVNIELALAGDIKKVKERIGASGTISMGRDKMLDNIKIIDGFAIKKSKELFDNAMELYGTLERQLILLTAVILLLSFIVNYVVLKNIHTPIKELNDATRRFHNGDMNARSSYEIKNEFGLLSESFNIMAENLQEHAELNKKIVETSNAMLSETDAKTFSQVTLNALAAQTGSQIAAIYLLSDDKKNYGHYFSIGLDDNAKQSFAADKFEGEFGSVLTSRKVQHIKNIPEDSRFVFHTVSGKFKPREILTLPILDDNEVIAIISLASVSTYSNQSIQFIDSLLDPLSARVEGILAYRKMKNISKILEDQNRELETQKSELTSQSTELVEQNTELEMQKIQLKEASHQKTVFLSNMSHELRTPLNSVIALSGVLNRRLANKIPDEEYSYLEVIERNGKNLLELINDILDISRIEAGREEIEITKFNANNVIADVVSMILPQAQQNKIELVYADGDTNLPITGDVDKWRHILQNIIGNAVKFTENGKVEIATRQSAKNITITVIDTGIGISEEHLPHIFDEFRQADSGTSRRFGGTGLGLAIAKKYANLLGGTITVQSVLGKGSQFTLIFPLHYAAENRIPEAEAATDFKYAIKQTLHQPVSGSSGKTILLVEDSEPAIIQMKDILGESGYRILLARNGGEALGIIAQTIPDAMILDLMMPGIDGFEVLRTIREAERTARIPVLILTAKHISKEELQFLKRNNIHQLIQKGDVNRNELLNAVAGMVSPQTTETKRTMPELQTIEGKPVVLVVEDNPDNMITVKALLADKYTVLEAMDGNKGVEMAKKEQLNLILMDIALPTMDGIEAFKTIRKLPKLQHIPIIALTVSAMTSDREAILAFGFDAYIAKPIDEHIFFKTINEILYGK